MKAAAPDATERELGWLLRAGYRVVAFESFEEERALRVLERAAAQAERTLAVWSLAAWRAVWGAQRANPVYAARYRHLTTRKNNKLRPTQAQTVIAAAILRHLYAVITTGQAWDPAIATHGNRARPQPAAAAA